MTHTPHAPAPSARPATPPRRIRGTRITDRDTTARRLLASAAKHSYDPQVDIDWGEPLEPGLFGMSPEWSSLYDTPLWEGMSPKARIRLTEHEFCSISGAGIWFEEILMQIVLRDVYDQDPSTAHVQFALTEIADECRHSIMFARAAEKFAAPSYRPSPRAHRLGRVLKSVGHGPNLYAAILVAEEVLDIFQRDMIDDERVQPLTRAISRIHVVEEARHMRFARDEVARRAVTLSGAQRAHQRLILGIVANVIVHNLIHPDAYAAAGLDPQTASTVARGNEHYSGKLRESARNLTTFLTEVGLIGGSSARLWHSARLL